MGGACCPLPRQQSHLRYQRNMQIWRKNWLRRSQRVTNNPPQPIDSPGRYLPSNGTDIATELCKNRLLVYPNKEGLPIPFTACPLRLTDKADGSKRRIHHVSYPTTDSSSINTGIPEHYGTITYIRIGEAIQAIQDMGKDCIRVKRDFESPFRLIPVSPLDSSLLGFLWESTYNAESFLPFGLQTVPYLFNLFAEVFHRILEDTLHAQGLRGRIIHYLDDFLIVLPPESNPEQYTTLFTKL